MDLEKNLEKEKKKGVDIRCPRCFSRMIYYRARKREFQCRFCGNVFKAPIELEE